MSLKEYGQEHGGYEHDSTREVELDFLKCMMLIGASFVASTIVLYSDQIESFINSIGK